jgi:hypothetical protein
VEVIGFVARRSRLGSGSTRRSTRRELPADTVVAACVMAVRMGRPHLVQTLAQDIQNAKAGHGHGLGSRNAIRRLNHDNKPKTAIDAAETMRQERERKGRR